MIRGAWALLRRQAAVWLAALVCCQCSGRMEGRADLVLINGAEVGSLDPAEVTAQTESRVVTAVFEGLMRYNERGRAEPGAAHEPVLSPDGRTYTFTIREDARWSNGDPVTSRDFYNSWMRMLEPGRPVDYVSVFYVIRNAEAWKTGRITDPKEVGLAAPDDRTFVVTLENPAPFFVDLCAFMTFCPVHLPSLEKHGRNYFKPGNLVGNGPYQMVEWRLNDRIRLRRNPHYWDAANVSMETVDVLPIDNPATALNLFLTGGADLILDKNLIPASVADELLKQPWFHSRPFLGSCFLRFNTTLPQFRDPRVRKALSMVIDRERIVRTVTRLGEPAAYSLTPPGAGGDYQPPPGLPYDIPAARKLLAEAGYPGGAGFPVLRYLYPSRFPADAGMAVELQAAWKQHLGITVDLQQQEWKVFLDSQRKMDYEVSKSSWLGDYNDPNTFLDLFVSTSGNNRTGWGNPEYDRLIAEAGAEPDPQRRLELFRRAEHLLIAEEGVIAPVYHFVSVQFFHPDRLSGIESNLLDEHPVRTMRWLPAPPQAPEPVAVRR